MILIKFYSVGLHLRISNSFITRAADADTRQIIFHMHIYIIDKLQFYLFLI